MKIVMVGPFGLRPKGTMSARALPLARALARRGHQVCLILPPWDAPSHAGRCWYDAGVLVRNLPLRFSLSPRTSPMLALGLLYASLQLKPNVLHLFKPIGYSGLIGMMTRARLLPRPALVFDLDDLEGRLGWADVVSRSGVERWLRDWQERWAMRHADGLTLASPILERLAGTAGVPRHRRLLLLNGCERRDIETAAAGLPVEVRRLCSRLGVAQDLPLLLWPTRHSEVSLARAAAVLAQVVARVPRVQILVAGTDLRGELQSWLNTLEEMPVLKGRLIKTGWLEEPMWNAVCLAADAGLVLLDDTPINRARCPARIPEMLSWGLPLVAERVGVVGEYVRHGQSGLLVEAGDANAIARAVADLLTRPDLLVSMAARTRQLVTERWSWDIQARLLESFYERILCQSDGCVLRQTRAAKSGEGRAG